ncbi:D-3-phosphoglycerate dehydrogenase [Pullulanibacillus camelliae]|uniref:D-3-phosphoglycerate dehydrogenase n=1 Tax=Pullulanibacillus camelliae TaxID=1707096 RepID=A0A8J2VUU7_9BACL|nr:phosphoglycerate dehydrogenase [Pullulanibacillus camelliae]GGE40563.1 D-3-phosphoglycerate dehydrogenase [Pullulanibacillus camelliae]
MTYKILISDPISDTGLAALKASETVELNVQTELTKEELVKIIGNYDGLIVRSQTQVDAAIIEAADHLRVIGRAGVGVDNIDLDAATKAGILVINAPDGNTISAAEHTMAMMTALSRQIPDACKSLKEGRWERKKFKGVELFKKTFGVVGFGRIGMEVAKRAKAYQMNILAYDPFLTDEKARRAGVTKATLDEIYTQADFITVHTPLTKETHHLIGAEAFNKMKADVRLINCARGGIIDELALYQAIKEGKVAGAAIDVFENEPPENHPLLTLPQVIATPHLGASTVEAQEKVARAVSEEILQIFNGEPAQHAVNLPPISDQVRRALEPYYQLSRQLGVTAVQLVKGAPQDIEITYSGELTDIETAPLTRSILQSVLAKYLGDHINPVNVKYYIKESGVTYNVKRTQQSHGFTGLIKVRLTSETDERSISGTLLNGYGPRIVKIDDYNVDLPTDVHLLYIEHHDLPGLIGQVGTVLGEHHINIGSMQVGRKSVGGHAIMVLTIDKNVNETPIDALQHLEHIQAVKLINL